MVFFLLICLAAIYIYIYIILQTHCIILRQGDSAYARSPKPVVTSCREQVLPLVGYFVQIAHREFHEHDRKCNRACRI
jgi:hypothetical protein